MCVMVCTVSGPVEADPEYQVIVAANNIVAEVDNELSQFQLCLNELRALFAFWLCVGIVS
jgi:hypothetical protein